MRKRRFNCKAALPDRMDIVVPRPFYVAITYCYCFIIFLQVLKMGQRLFGRDCDGGTWHSHPIENPDGHDFSKDGLKEISLEDFLYEVSEKLVNIGIL